MALPRKPVVCCALALLLAGTIMPALAAPPATASSAAQRQHDPTERWPDYGGRDSVGAFQNAGTEVGPAAQGLRALESLVVVLALVAGGVWGAKRLGLVGKDGRLSFAPGTLRPKHTRTAAQGDPIAVRSSQALPGGGGLHVVTVAGRTLLLGATAQSVTLLTELNAAESVPEDIPDAPFLPLVAKRVAQTSVPAVSAAADRLQTLLSQSRAVSPTGSY